MQAREQYLLNEVMTATPQKLQLMLIEAALRQGQAADEHRQAGREDQASEALIRCQEIVSQLLAGLNPQRDRDLCRRVAAVYSFVFRRLTAAHVELTNRRWDRALFEAMQILEIERDTWRQVCQVHGTSRIEPHRPAAAESASGLSFQI